LGPSAINLLYGVDQGAKVAAQYNTTSSTLKPLEEKYGSQLIVIQADVTSETSITNLFQTLTAQEFRTQVIVLNHGLWPTQDVPMADMKLEQWEKTVAVNLTSNFMLARGYLNGLKTMDDSRKNFAAVISVGSTAGKVGEANHADYSSAKSGRKFLLIC